MFEEIKKEIQDSPEYREAVTALIQKKLVDGLSDMTLISQEKLVNDTNAKDLIEEIKQHREKYLSGKVAFENHGEGSEIITAHMYDENGVDVSSPSISSAEAVEIESDFKILQDSYEKLKNISVDFDFERSRIEQEKISRNTL